VGAAGGDFVLVANVATAYFQLRALDSQLEISKRTLASRQQSLKLTEFLENHGFELRTRRKSIAQLVYTASETIPDLERQIQQQENLLSILLGEIPVPLPAVRPLRSSPCPSPFPLVCLQNCARTSPGRSAGRRIIVAANAQIGVAKASFFPSISLTGTGGLRKQRAESVHQHTLPDLVRRLSVSQPVFQAGALRSGLRLSRAQYQEAVLSYQQTVQNAFEQVSNSLVALKKIVSSASSRNCSRRQHGRRINCPRCSTRMVALVTPGADQRKQIISRGN